LKSIFKNIPVFTVLFFIVLATDISIKIFLVESWLRYISKPLVILSLLCFYLFNEKEVDRKKFKWMVVGLCCFLLGDLFLITHLNLISLLLGMSLFMAGKVFYAIRFSHTSDFKLGRLVPFLLIIFAYIAVLFSFIYDQLNELFVPVLFYFFVSLIMVQMVFLRRDAVNFKSYMIVLIAVEIFVIGETVMAFL